MRGVQRTNQISVFQMVCILLICRFYQFLTYTPSSSGQAKGIWSIVSIFCSGILTFVLLLPVLILNRKYPGLSMIECIGNASPGYARAVALCYGIFAVAVALYTISTFNTFISSTILPQASMLFLSATMVLAAWYAASRGMEPSARLAFIVCICFVVSLFFIIRGVVPYLKFHTITKVPDNHAVWNFLKTVWLGTARDMEAILFILMLPYVKGDRKKGLFWYLVLYSVLAVLAILLIWFSLGKLAQYQRFPFYTVASMAKAPLLERMDAIHIALWTFFAYLRAGVYLYLAGICFSHFKIQDTAKRVLSILGMIGLIAAAVLLSKSTVLLTGLRFLLSSGIFVLILVVGIPVSILVMRRKLDETD